MMASRPDTLELALVDKDLLLKLLQQKPPPTPVVAPPTDPDLTQMAATGQIMDGVLKSQTMTPHSQRNAYSELLAVKNLHGKRYADEGVFNNNNNMDASNSGGDTSEDGDTVVTKKVVSQLTPLQAERARALLKHLALQDPAKISWDAEGSLSINGRPLPGVDIVNLVTHLSRNRAGDRTPPEFVQLLPELDIPTQLIQNRKVQASAKSATRSKAKIKRVRHDRRDVKGRFSKPLTASAATSSKSPYPGQWEKLND